MRLPNRFLISILLSTTVKCNEVQKYTNFNENLREYSDNKDYNVSSADNVKTLQSEQLARYAYFVPSTGPIPIKDISDNALASSSHVKGFTPHSKIGYALHDEHDPEHGHYGYGYDYYLPNIHEFDHHDLGHGYGHHAGYHHHKHYDHGLATKAILWPIAGIALLGAAAALVSNPILLQLGVVSGKRRRRDTEEVTSPDFETDFIKTLKKQNHNVATQETKTKATTAKSKDENEEKKKIRLMRKKLLRQDMFLKKEHRINPVYSFSSTNVENDGLVPIPLQVRRKIQN